MMTRYAESYQNGGPEWHALQRLTQQMLRIRLSVTAPLEHEASNACGMNCCSHCAVRDALAERVSVTVAAALIAQADGNHHEASMHLAEAAAIAHDTDARLGSPVWSVWMTCTEGALERTLVAKAHAEWRSLNGVQQ